MEEFCAAAHGWHIRKSVIRALHRLEEQAPG